MNLLAGAHLVTLGTAAGPAIRSQETGIASALVVDGHAYLVDFGLGMTRRLSEAGIKGENVVAGFVTHLHSDHVIELPSFVFWNWGPPVDGFTSPIRLLGPGKDPANPALAGFGELVERTLEAYSYDVAIREVDEGRPQLRELLDAEEIAVPEGATPENCEPFTIFEDEHVRVTAVLTPHPPVFPAFAFRFDTAYGSVTFSGDTAKSETLTRLAQGTDILVHEAVNADYFREQGVEPAFLQHQLNSHTTPAEAGEVARDAEVQHLVLSHLAGVATDDYWKDEAQSAFDGPITVAKSGNVFSLTSAHQPLLTQS